MGNVIEASPSGRARCRGCQKGIERGELRFGERCEPSSSGGEGVLYWHLLCAARRVPSLVRAALPRFRGAIPDRPALEAALSAGERARSAAPSPYPRGEVAPTGRARCMMCEDLLEKGKIRVAVERDTQTPSGMTVRTAGYMHPACALSWADEGGGDPRRFAAQVLHNSRHLSDPHRAALVAGFEA